jgi:hypothetical protein
LFQLYTSCYYVPFRWNGWTVARKISLCSDFSHYGLLLYNYRTTWHLGDAWPSGQHIVYRETREEQDKRKQTERERKLRERERKAKEKALRTGCPAIATTVASTSTSAPPVMIPPAWVPRRPRPTNEGS